MAHLSMRRAALVRRLRVTRSRKSTQPRNIGKAVMPSFAGCAGLLDWQFNDRQPVESRDGRRRRQNLAAVAVVRNLSRSRNIGPGGASCLDVSETGNIAPDQAQVGMRKDLVLRINNVSNATFADLGRAHEVLAELEIDLRNYHPVLATRAGDRQGHV